MISFEREIKELLYENNFLVLPGLGAFMARFEQPGLDNDNNIRGPFKTFEFNALIKEDLNAKFFEILLARHKISSTDLISAYESFVSDVLIAVRKDLPYPLPGLGHFIRGRDGAVDFIIEESINFYDTQQEDSQKQSRKKINIEHIEFVPREYPEEVAPPKKTTRHRRKSPFPKFLLYAFPILALLGGLVYMLFLKKDPIIARKNSSAIVETFDSTSLPPPLSDSLVYQADSLIESPVTEVQTEEKNVPVSQEKAEEESYMVTVGIFRDQSNINQLKHQLKENGISAQTEKLKKFTRVYVMAASEDEAGKIVRKVEQLTGDKAVYNKIK